MKLQNKINRLNNIGKNSTPPFAFVSMEGRSKNNHLRVKIKNLETKEEAVRDLTTLVNNGRRNPWRAKGKKLLDFKIDKKNIEKKTLKFNPPVKILKEAGQSKWGNRLFQVQNLKTKETKITSKSQLNQGYNPWGTSLIPIEEVKKKIHKTSLKKYPRFKVLGYADPVKGDTTLRLKNLETGEEVVRLKQQTLSGSNPWKSNLEPIKKFKKRMVKITKKFDPPIEILEYAGYNTNLQTLVRIKNKITKEEITTSKNDLVGGHNPFNEKTRNLESIKDFKKRISKVIRKFSPQIDVLEYAGYSNNQLLVKIKNKKTKEERIVRKRDLSKGHNSFNDKISNNEKDKVHPKIKKILNKHNVDYKYEYKIGKKAVPDFIVFFNKRIFIIEAKFGDSCQSKPKMIKQLERYHKAANLKFKRNIPKKNVILVSDSGKIGKSLVELDSMLNNLNHEKSKNT